MKDTDLVLRNLESGWDDIQRFMESTTTPQDKDIIITDVRWVTINTWLSAQEKENSLLESDVKVSSKCSMDEDVFK